MSLRYSSHTFSEKNQNSINKKHNNIFFPTKCRGEELKAEENDDDDEDDDDDYIIFKNRSEEDCLGAEKKETSNSLFFCFIFF